MILKMYTFHDSKAECYGRPWFAPADGAAIRMFQDLLSDQETDFSKHPSDYTLFAIGEFDDSNAECSPYVPKALGNGLDLLPT